MNSISLVSVVPPWIQTQVINMFTPTHDTYDLYEAELKTLTGSSYFRAGALMRVSAGGLYLKGDQSYIQITAEGSRILDVANSGLAVTYDDTRETAWLALPDPHPSPSPG